MTVFANVLLREHELEQHFLAQHDVQVLKEAISIKVVSFVVNFNTSLINQLMHHTIKEDQRGRTSIINHENNYLVPKKILVIDIVN